MFELSPKVLNKFLTTHWPLIVLFLVICVFYLHLFFPKPSLFITPDYGQSDLLHSKIPTQMIMWENLRQFSLPLWDTRIYQGFPVLGEGEIGFFYLPNLLLYAVLPFWLAFNLSYPLNTLITAVGTYFLARSFGLNKTGSYLAAITFSFAPVLSLNVHHYNAILSLAWVPWAFFLVNSFFQKKRLIYLLVLPLVLAQQHFAGFPQYATYTHIFLSLFFFYKLTTQFKKASSYILLSLLFIITIAFGILISSIQLYATYQLTREAQKLEATSASRILEEFPYTPKNLLTLLDPYILGNQKDATYPRWQPGEWGMFWENNTYIGLVQLALFLVSPLLFFKKTLTQKEKNHYLFWIFLFFIGILLSLGKFAPLHPIFSFPPISFFRVPSRFLFITFLAGAIIAASVLSKLLAKNRLVINILAIVLMTMATVDIFRAWYSYNLTAPKDELFNEPYLAKYIQKDQRIATIGQVNLWNNTFLNEGFVDNAQKYLFFKNFFEANSNIIANRQQVNGYESIVPKRTQVAHSLITSQIEAKDEKFTIGKVSDNALSMAAVDFITSSKEINSENWQFIDKVETPEQSVFLYKNKRPVPKVTIAKDIRIAKTKTEAAQILSQELPSIENLAILEETVDIETNGYQNSTVQLEQYQNQTVRVRVDLSKDAILLLRDTYYPGWKAYVDQKETKIMPANINSRAVLVPQGTHEVIFSYRPSYIYSMGAISAVFLLITLVVIFKLRKSTLSPTLA